MTALVRISNFGDGVAQRLLGNAITKDCSKVSLNVQLIT